LPKYQVGWHQNVGFFVLSEPSLVDDSIGSGLCADFTGAGKQYFLIRLCPYVDETLLVIDGWSIGVFMVRKRPSNQIAQRNYGAKSVGLIWCAKITDTFCVVGRNHTVVLTSN
jgi:hypothetical protein